MPMNRKATFAKRQRETDLKEHAKQKEERRANRRANPKATKGPEIAWDEAVDVSTTPYGETVDGAGGPDATGEAGASGDGSGDADRKPGDADRKPGDADRKPGDADRKPGAKPNGPGVAATPSTGSGSTGS